MYVHVARARQCMYVRVSLCVCACCVYVTVYACLPGTKTHQLAGAKGNSHQLNHKDDLHLDAYQM